MSNRNIDVDKNTLSFQEIKSSDTISQFMEKVNNNFRNINFNNAGPKGDNGDEGPQGAPTKPKVPIHAWVKGEQYEIENKIGEDFFEVTGYEGKVDLSDIKYEEGHLIVLDNGHAYILELNEGILKPKYIMAIQSVDPTIKIDGKTAYLHIAFTNDINNKDSFITYNKLKESKKSISSYLYIGVISSTDEVYEEAPELPSAYTWLRFKSDDCIASLSTPIVHLLVGEDNSCIQNTQSISTDVYLHHNFSEVAKENFTITIPSNLIHNNLPVIKHFSINSNKITFNPIITEGNENTVFKFGNNTHFKVPISISYKLDDSSSEYKTTIDWTLTPIKSIKDVEVFVDKKVVNISKPENEDGTHNLKVGYYLISNGNKTFIDNDNDNKYYIILTNEVKNKYNTSDSISDWSKATYDFSKNHKCYVVLVDSNGYTVDYTVVTTVENGVTPTIEQNTDKNYYWAINKTFIEVGDDKQLIRANGIDGSSIHLELDKDRIILPYNINTNDIHPSYNNDIIFRCHLYNNNSIIDVEDLNLKFTLSPLNSNKTIYSDNRGEFNISIPVFKEFIKNDFGNENILKNEINEFIVQIEYDNVMYTKTLLVELKETPYRVEFDKNILIRDTNGDIKDTTLSGSIKYFNTSWELETNEIIQIKASWEYNNNEHNYVVNVNTDDNNKTGKFEFNFTDTDTDKHKIPTGINYINIKAYTISNDDYNNNSEPLTTIYEGKIPIVNDGEKGETGTLNELVTVEKNENNINIKQDSIVLGSTDNKIITISCGSNEPVDLLFKTILNDGGIAIKSFNDIKKDDNIHDVSFEVSPKGIFMKVNDFNLNITENGIEKIIYNTTTLTINHISASDGNIIFVNNIKVPSGDININDFLNILNNEILNLSFYNFDKWTINDTEIGVNSQKITFKENDIIVGEYEKKTFNVNFYDHKRKRLTSETVYAYSNINEPTPTQRNNFTFAGWLDNTTLYGDILDLNNYKVKKNLDLNATYNYSTILTHSSLSEIENYLKNTSDGYKSYVISQPYHKEGETSWYCISKINNETNEYEYEFKASYGEELDITNGGQQFLFIPIENITSERQLFYIYNVYQKKYIKSDCTLSDDPKDTFSFRDTGKYGNTYMLQFVDVENKTNKIINIDTSRNNDGSPNPKMYINDYATKDGGNSCEIRDTNIKYFSVSFYKSESKDGTGEKTLIKTLYILSGHCISDIYDKEQDLYEDLGYNITTQQEAGAYQFYNGSGTYDNYYEGSINNPGYSRIVNQNTKYLITPW